MERGSGSNNGTPRFWSAHILGVGIIMPYNGASLQHCFHQPAVPFEHRPPPLTDFLRIGDTNIPMHYHQRSVPPLQAPNIHPHQPNFDANNPRTYAGNLEMQVVASLQEELGENVDPDMVNVLVELVQATLEALEGHMDHCESVGLSVEIEEHTGLSEEVIMSHLGASKFQASSEDEDSCCICLDGFSTGDELGKINCDHKFHFTCIREWLKRKNICPVCRALALFESMYFCLHYFPFRL